MASVGFVQSASANSPSGTSVTVTLAAPATAGNFLVAMVAATSGVAFATPVGWAIFTGSRGTANNEQAISFSKTAAGGETALTFSKTQTGQMGVIVCEFSNVLSATGNSAVGTGTVETWPSSNPSVTGQLFIELSSCTLYNTTVSTPAGYTALPQLTGQYWQPVGFYLINPATGSNGAQPATLSQSDDWVAVIGRLLPGAGVTPATGNAGSAAGAIGTGRNPGGAIGNG